MAPLTPANIEFYEDAFPVYPSDAQGFAFPVKAIYVGGEGDLRIKTVRGTTLTFIGLPAGSILPVATAQVLDTGTNATALIALY
jgi:hypothetical protein